MQQKFEIKKAKNKNYKNLYFKNYNFQNIHSNPMKLYPHVFPLIEDKILQFKL